VISPVIAGTALWLTLILTPNLLAVMPTPVVAVQKKGHTPTLADRNIVIRALICAYALKYDVEPAAAMAVARIESGTRVQEFRTGFMGRTYLGPFGIHKCFLKKWPVDQLECNIEVGVRAIARYKDLKVSLKKYNTAFNEGYWRAVTTARAQYRRSGVTTR
jgi:hypothetical protein